MDEMNKIPYQPAKVQMQTILPNSTATMVLGIMSIACLCCFVIGFVMGIIGIVLGVITTKQYRQSPGVYTEASYKNAKVGKICSIIGLVLCVLHCLAVVMFWAAYKDGVRAILQSYGII